MIPEDKIHFVQKALTAAFGTTEIEDIRAMPRGMSSDLVFRIVVKGSALLLKIMTRMDERNDPRRIFPAMKAGAEAGLAPRVWYAGMEDGVSITDFVETVPLSVGEARERIPATLRALHGLAPFAKAFNFVTAHKGFIWRFRSANLLPAGEVEEVFGRYEQLCAVYPRLEADMVASHGDLKPENILFDGERLWLVDWQAAFLNDRYFDLSVVANFVVTGDGDEAEFLGRYFGQTPDDYQLGRFFLMRQMMHLFYATVFLLLGAGGKAVDPGEEVPLFREFHERIWAGEINLANKGMMVLYGRVHWRQLLENVRGERFGEALLVVGERHAGELGLRRLLPVADASTRLL